MKNTNRYAVSLMSGIAFLLLGSCSEKVSDDLGGAENETLDIWMQNNRPDIPKAEDGLYYKIYETEDSQDIDVEWRNWVSVTYTGQALNGYFPENGGRFTGDYYENFYPEIARELGTFSYFCHYVPYLTNNNELLQYTLTPGATKVLRQMQQGDSVEIFMTSQHAYGSGGYFSQLEGFEGNKELEGNRPVYMSMKLCEVIADPVKIDEEKTIAYAVDELGLQAQDSIAENLYLKLETELPGAAEIPLDTTVTIWYVAKFTDGFIFDTNIDSLARELHIYDEDEGSYTPFSITYDNGEADDIVDGLIEAVKHMRVGEKGTTVFSSSWGYGAAGDSNGKTLVQPYTPLVFEVEVIAPEAEE